LLGLGILAGLLALGIPPLLPLLGILGGPGILCPLGPLGALGAFGLPGEPRALAEEREVLYWYDPMYPGTRFDKPGKSPFMDMELVPRYRDEGEGAGILIDPAMTQNLGVSTARAALGRLSLRGEYAATVDFNGYLTARIQPRAEGFVSKTYELFPGDLVAEGAPIAEITVPAWASDQSDYLLLKKQGADPPIIRGVREKLRLSGMPEDMLRAVDRSGKTQTTLVIRAPLAGVLTELGVYPGMNVGKEMTLAVVQGLDPAWVTAQVPEGDLGLVGGRARITLPGYPGMVFPSEGATLLPKADAASRTVPVRFRVPNPDGLLIPGLTARVTLRAQGGEGVIIPLQCLIDLGDETRVITRSPGGAFVPKRVVVGASSGEEALILSGLDEGEELVLDGLFLIDSESNLRGALDRMAREGAAQEGMAAGGAAPEGGAPDALAPDGPGPGGGAHGQGQGAPIPPDAGGPAREGGRP
jgi:Cu(I)/Ag(I) efflux system membrane fusion protein